MRWLLLMILLLGTKVSGEENRGLYARITVLEPKEGMASEFEAGYRRHLDWNKNHDDRWTWYGWTIATGERTGVFIDGTFGRTTRRAPQQRDHERTHRGGALPPRSDVRAGGLIPASRALT